MCTYIEHFSLAFAQFVALRGCLALRLRALRHILLAVRRLGMLVLPRAGPLLRAIRLCLRFLTLRFLALRLRAINKLTGIRRLRAIRLVSIRFTEIIETSVKKQTPPEMSCRL